jgi:hypothetical protein
VVGYGLCVLSAGSERLEYLGAEAPCFAFGYEYALWFLTSDFFRIHYFRSVLSEFTLVGAAA